MPSRYVAHRGGAAQWPENSLTAFRNAIAGGAQILECDVHLTADGEVAVMHDPTLDRTSSGTGPLARCTLADLRRARLRGPGGALTEDCVPTLGELLALAAPVVLALLVEIKTPGPAVRYERRGDRFVPVPGARYEGLERKILELLREAGIAERSFILAFNPAVLAEVRALSPKQPLALLVDWIDRRKSNERVLRVSIHARDKREVLFETLADDSSFLTSQRTEGRHEGDGTGARRSRSGHGVGEDRHRDAVVPHRGGGREERQRGRGTASAVGTSAGAEAGQRGGGQDAS